MVKLDDFIIMPDHLHGIIVIKSMVVETPNLGVSTDTNDNIVDRLSMNNKMVDQIMVETPNLGVSTQKMKTSQIHNKIKNHQWKPNSVGSIINQFKRACTIRTRESDLDVIWQPRYFDHIIKFKKELKYIRKYILENPEHWFDEKDYSDPFPKQF